MGCTCRVTPLRFFIQGLSQVHRLETSSFLRHRAPTAAVSTYNNQLVIVRQSRLLHISRHLSQDANANGFAPSEAPKESSSTRPTTNETPTINENPQDTPEPSKNTKLAEPSEPTDYTESAAPEQPVPWKRGQRHLDNFKSARNNRFRDDGRNVDKPGKPPRWAASEKTQQGRPWKSYDLNSWKPTRDNRAPTVKFDDPSIEEPKQDKPFWKTQKEALKEKFPEGWNPRKRLSPDALAGIRALNAQFPDIYTTSTLAKKFEVSPENIRRILKSKWQPNIDEEKNRQERWFKRGMQVWDRQAALGMKPPRKWRLEGITRDPDYHVRRQAAIKRNRNLEEQDDREVRANMRKPSGGSFSGKPFSGRPSSNRPYPGKPSDKPPRS